MRISDWSSDVCSSDLEQHDRPRLRHQRIGVGHQPFGILRHRVACRRDMAVENREQIDLAEFGAVRLGIGAAIFGHDHAAETRGETRRQRRFSGAFGAVKADVTGHAGARSEEHTSELQSLMRISYAVFCLKKKTIQKKREKKRKKKKNCNKNNNDTQKTMNQENYTKNKETGHTKQ